MWHSASVLNGSSLDKHQNPTYKVFFCDLFQVDFVLNIFLNTNKMKATLAILIALFALVSELKELYILFWNPDESEIENYRF